MAVIVAYVSHEYPTTTRLRLAYIAFTSRQLGSIDRPFRSNLKSDRSRPLSPLTRPSNFLSTAFGVTPHHAKVGGPATAPTTTPSLQQLPLHRHYPPPLPHSCNFNRATAPDLGCSTPSMSAGAAGAGVLVDLIHASTNLASVRSLLSFHRTVGAIFTSVTCVLYRANEPVFE